VDGVIPLESLAVGQSASVSEVVGPAHHVQRMEEFGIRGGTKIEMYRVGNPCIIRTFGGKVCLRADGILDIMVKPLGTTS